MHQSYSVHFLFFSALLCVFASLRAAVISMFELALAQSFCWRCEELVVGLAEFFWDLILEG